ncbi:hypothetical protein ES703_44419 [subsurface metagenome]
MEQDRQQEQEAHGTVVVVVTQDNPGLVPDLKLAVAKVRASKG